MSCERSCQARPGQCRAHMKLCLDGAAGCHMGTAWAAVLHMPVYVHVYACACVRVLRKLWLPCSFLALTLLRHVHYSYVTAIHFSARCVARAAPKPRTRCRGTQCRACQLSCDGHTRVAVSRDALLAGWTPLPAEA